MENILQEQLKVVLSAFYGLDISPTSCELTQKMVKQQVGGLITKCDFLCQDFFTYDFDKKADLIVIGEVLEHVEKPLEFLKRSKELLSDGGKFCNYSYQCSCY